jgi:hypothetical protein
LLNRRVPSTYLVVQTRASTIEAFIDYLTTDRLTIDPSGMPLGNLVIFSHGFDKGWMQIDLDRNHIGQATVYEVIEDAIRGSQHPVLIKDTLHQKLPPPNPPPPPVEFDVHIRGCRIGRTPIFVARLKEAFKSPRSVTAPLHFHVAGVYPGNNKPSDDDASLASYEYLLYSFQLFRTKPYKQKELGLAIREFNQKGFEYIPQLMPDGSIGQSMPVPEKIWRDMIKEKEVLEKFTFRSYYEEIDLGSDIGEGNPAFPIQHLTKLSAEKQFRHELDTHKTGIISNVAEKPTSKADLMVLIRKEILNDPMTKSTFPLYARHGFDNVEDFLNPSIVNWEVISYDHKKQELVCQGSRHVYTVLVPVRDPSSGILLCNVFPDARSGIKPHTKLPVTDVRLFLTVTLVDYLASITELHIFGSPTCNANIAIASVIASGSQGSDIPQNVLDNNPGTRWANNGAGSWIRAELGSTQNTCSVDIAWYEGNKRKYVFVISTSTDGTTFTDISATQSTGTTLNPEKYSFAPINAKYVRITVNVNIQ